MELSPSKTLGEIAEILNCEFIGDKDHVITGLNEIHKVRNGDLVFVDHPKYYDKALNSAATTILIDKKVDCPEGKGLLISDSPFDAFNQLIRTFSPFTPLPDKICDTVEMGEDCVIHPTVIIGRNTVIGDRCVIHPNVVIQENTVIGNDVVIQANSVIGGDGLYYKQKPEGRERLLSCGYVELEDDVEIGAGCTIDRGVTDVTRLGKGTKLDNMVHIGHDALIGKNCLIVAQVAIGGNVTLEDNVILWGQVGIPANLTIGKDAILLATSAATKDLPGGKTYFGSPAEETRKKYREMASLRQLPDIIAELKKK